MERCEHCWEMARLDATVRRHVPEFRYRTIVRVFHGRTWNETGTRDPHMEDPYRL